MGKKYTINSSGYAIAERDIHSLGGLVPKGSQGAKLASEDQLSQFGECWIANGDATAYGDLRVTDDAYVHDIASNVPSVAGPLRIGGSSRLTSGFVFDFAEAAHAPGTHIIDSEVLTILEDAVLGSSSGPATEHMVSGGINTNAPLGTDSASMLINDTSAVRTAGIVVVCKSTKVVNVPIGSTAEAVFLYSDKTDYTFRYAGNRVSVNGILDLSHDTAVYALIVVWNPEATTPEDFDTKGVKIIRRVNSSRKIHFNNNTIGGSEASIINSNVYLLRVNTWFFAGSIKRCDDVLLYLDSPDNLVVSGVFTLCKKIEIHNKYIDGSQSSLTNNKKTITVSGCPLLRLDIDTITPELVAKRNLVLRNCIVPKAMFVDDVVNGNTYEGVDFSFANAHLGVSAAGGILASSHTQGLYNVVANGNIIGQISRPGNLGATAVLQGRIIDTKLDGDLIEQGNILTTLGVSIDDLKDASTLRVRFKRTMRTKSLSLISLPTGFTWTGAVYFSEVGLSVLSVGSPTAVNSTYPYVALTVGKTNGTALTPKEFIALGLALRSYDYAQVPQVTGSGYIGSGVTASGDVQVHGLPYIERVFDADTFEQGGVTITGDQGASWESLKVISAAQSLRLRSKRTFPVTPGGVITLGAGFSFYVCTFNNSGGLVSDSGTFVQSFTVPEGIYRIGVVLTALPEKPIIPSEVAAANLKYVNTFPTRRYITNELDRAAAWDTLLGPEMWENTFANNAPVGTLYNALKAPNSQWLTQIKPLNLYSWGAPVVSGYSTAFRPLDGTTKLLSDAGTGYRAQVGWLIRKNPQTNISPEEAPAARLVVTFVNTPRIVVPYGVSNINVEAKVWLTDNAVLGTSVFGKAIALTGDAVLGEVPGYEGDPCVCAQGEGDANIKYPQP